MAICTFYSKNSQEGLFIFFPSVTVCQTVANPQFAISTGVFVEGEDSVKAKQQQFKLLLFMPVSESALSQADIFRASNS